MKKFYPLIFLSIIFLFSCHRRSGFRIYTQKNREGVEDSISWQSYKDTIHPLAGQLTYEKYNFMTDLIVQNLVRAQKMVYEKRYTEAVSLTEQTLVWYPTPEAYLLLGSIYDVKGDLKKRDSCWILAKKFE